MNELNLDDGTEKDLVDVALEQAVREGRIVKSLDDEGRVVYTVSTN